jgi:hypothetical protein
MTISQIPDPTVDQLTGKQQFDLWDDATLATIGLRQHVDLGSSCFSSFFIPTDPTAPTAEPRHRRPVRG